MNALSSWPASRTDRHATALLHDSAGCRIVAFTLAPGQTVPVHTSAAAVIVTVLDGEGVFTGAEGERTLQAGESANSSFDHGASAAGIDGAVHAAEISSHRSMSETASTPSPSGKRSTPP